MTLAEFRATGRDTKDLGEVHPPYKGVRGRVYAQNLWVARYHSGKWYIVDPVRIGTLEQCEAWLYGKLKS